MPIQFSTSASKFTPLTWFPLIINAILLNRVYYINNMTHSGTNIVLTNISLPIGTIPS